MFGWLFPEPRHGKHLRKQLYSSRRVAIAHCRDGERQRVTGIVDGVASLVAPVTGRPCVHWIVTIDEVGHGDWVERGTADAGVPFLLRDDTGSARVDPTGSRCDLVPSVSTFVALAALGPGAFSLYQQLKITLNYPHTSKVRFNEGIITPGMQITVLGNHQREPLQDASAADADAAGYRGELPMRPVFSSSRRRPLLIGHA